MEKFSFFCPIHNGVTFSKARLSRAQASGDEQPQPEVGIRSDQHAVRLVGSAPIRDPR